MVKIGVKEIGIDEGLNLALGSGALINSALWILAPSKVHVRSTVRLQGSLPLVCCTGPPPIHRLRAVQKFAAKNGSNKAITRIGGTGLLNMGVNHVTAGLRGDAIRNKDHLRVRSDCGADRRRRIISQCARALSPNHP